MRDRLAALWAAALVLVSSPALAGPEAAGAAAEGDGAAPVALPCEDAPCEEGPASRAFIPEGWTVRPYVVIVGGLEAEHVVQPEDGALEDRVTTLALSRFGFKGEVARGIYVESELEANAGPHGTSVWEGQAALQVRNQLIRVSHGRWMGEVGRITDEASLNFVSMHALDQLGMDTYIRTPLLYAGFNRGNGLRGTMELVGGLKLGLTFNAANPVSTTGAVMIGGTFPPFSRFYFAPHGYIASSANTYPLDTFHLYLVSPSLLLDRRHVKLRAGYQRFNANTNTTTDEDERINGFNVRASAMLLLAQRRLRPFASASYIQNDTVDPTNGFKLSGDLYTSLSLGGGADVVLPRGFGVGAQYDRIQEQQGEGSVRVSQFVNVGATRFLNEVTSVTLRGALYAFEEDSETFKGPKGERSVFLTMRVAL